MSPLALNKEYSDWNISLWSPAGLFLHSRKTLFPKPVLSLGSCPWNRLNCFIKNHETLGAQLPLREICGVPDYTGLSQEIIVYSCFRPWHTKGSYVAEEGSCWSFRPAWDLPLPLLPDQDIFPPSGKCHSGPWNYLGFLTWPWPKFFLF